MPKLLTDGFVTLPRGCHEGLAINMLPEGYYAKGVNISSRGGLIKTRPHFVKIADLGSGESFNGAFIFSLNSAERLVYGIDGIVRSYNITSETPEARVTGLTSRDMYFCKADRFCIVQDTENRPVFLYEDGDSIDGRQAIDYRAYDPDYPDTTYNEIFTGGVMAFGHGRIYEAASYIHSNDGLPYDGTYYSPQLTGKPYFIAGDILKPNDPDNVLKFTSTTYLDEGGAIALSSELGFITGMALIRNAQTGTGVGALIVLAQHGVAAFSVQASRNQWKDSDFGQVLFFSPGNRSRFGYTNMNNDILFRATDGIRDLQYSASQVTASGSLSNTPVSFEIISTLSLDTSEDLDQASMAFAGNRLLLTTAGRENEAFRGLVSLDTANFYAFRQEISPAYDGVWTGFEFMQVLEGYYKGVEAHFAVVRNGGQFELWALDNGWGGEEHPLCRLYTGALAFGAPTTGKRFSHAEIWIRDLTGDASLNCYFRPDGYALWNTCETVHLASDADGLPQSRYRVRMVPQSNMVCDPVTGRSVMFGTSFQFCLEWTGNLAIEKCMFYSEPEAEEPVMPCSRETAKALTSGSGGFEIDDYTYEAI